jgi:heme exporter protein C
MHRFANPARFMRIANACLPWLAAICALSLAAGLWFALFASPADYQQGDTVRIMYVHVPSAWMGMFCYVALAVFGAMALIWRHPLADLLARATAPVGAGFTLICLVSGSMWGRPMWGTWWVWDARLTSMLLLLFLYLGHMALSHAFDDRARGDRAAAILALVGVVNVPVIKFSVDWWNTMHQPASVIKKGGPAIDSSMLVPLLLMALGFQTYYFVVLILRARAEIAAAKVEAIRMAQVLGPGREE